MIFNIGGMESQKAKLPEFSYSGNYKLIDDGKDGGTRNWRIKLHTSGTLKFTKVVDAIDVFLVGGGGGGGGGGGAGGYTKTTRNVAVSAGTEYSIVIGAGAAGLFSSSDHYANASQGGTTTAFGSSAEGGWAGVGGVHHSAVSTGWGGSGGGGFGAGAGGSDGSAGSDGGWPGGAGQGTTTREFGETTGDLYAGGGGGGDYDGWGNRTGAGGAGGGGNGSGTGKGANGTANTGGGGGGGFRGDPSYYGGDGGSGIVVIRNAR